MHRYFVINKPYDMVSQFVSPDNVRLLGDLGVDFPEGTHAVGRLDGNSEGLLILTTNKSVTRILFQGERPHERRYLVLVKNQVSQTTLSALAAGIPIRIKGGGQYISAPVAIELVDDAQKQYLFAVDEREKYPHSWLLITLTEGKFHQVRKMVFAAGHRCLRLIRVSIEALDIGDMKPGEVRELDEQVFFERIGYAPRKGSFAEVLIGILGTCFYLSMDVQSVWWS